MIIGKKFLQIENTVNFCKCTSKNDLLSMAITKMWKKFWIHWKNCVGPTALQQNNLFCVFIAKASYSYETITENSHTKFEEKISSPFQFCAPLIEFTFDG